jgi:hypothetical protein
MIVEHLDLLLGTISQHYLRWKGINLANVAEEILIYAHRGGNNKQLSINV